MQNRDACHKPPYFLITIHLKGMKLSAICVTSSFLLAPQARSPLVQRQVADVVHVDLEGFLDHGRALGLIGFEPIFSVSSSSLGLQ